MTTRFLMAGAALLGALTLGAATGHATVFGGTATFTDNGPANNGVSFSATGIDSPFTTPSLTAGGSYTFANFATINGSDNGSGIFGSNKSYTDNVTLDLTFTLPGDGSDSEGGSATESTSLFGFINTGSVSWNGTEITDGTGTYAQDLVSFADGASAYVDIYNVALTSSGQDSVTGGLEVRIVDVTDPTPVPEPGTLALLGSGLLGLGFFGRLRTRSRPGGSAAA